MMMKKDEKKSRGELMQDIQDAAVPVRYNNGVYELYGKPATETDVVMWVTSELQSPGKTTVDYCIDLIRMYCVKPSLSGWTFIESRYDTGHTHTPPLLELFADVPELEKALRCIMFEDARKMFILQGAAGAGKSFILKILAKFFGPFAAYRTPTELTGRFGFGGLAGKCCVLSDDIGTETFDSAREGAIKTILTGGTVVIDEKFRRQYEAHMKAHIVMCANILPTYSILDDGMRRRVCLLEFPARRKIVAYEKLVKEFTSQKELANLYSFLKYKYKQPPSTSVMENAAVRGQLARYREWHGVTFARHKMLGGRIRVESEYDSLQALLDKYVEE